MSRDRRAYGPEYDPRFALHQRQPRANKLDQRQRQLCAADPAYADALAQRVSNPARFTAFLARVPSYVAIEAPCPKCGNYRRRTRDRSCYACHLASSGANFERIRAGLAPVVGRSKDSHLDLLERRKAERDDEHIAGQFGEISAKRWPTGRLEVTFDDGYVVPDFRDLKGQEYANALEMFPVLREVLLWAGWW